MRLCCWTFRSAPRPEYSHRRTLFSTDWKSRLVSRRKAQRSSSQSKAIFLSEVLPDESFFKFYKMNPVDDTVSMHELLGACPNDEDQKEVYVRFRESVRDRDENDRVYFVAQRF